MTDDRDEARASLPSSEDQTLEVLWAKASPAYALRERLFKNMLNIELRYQYLAVRTSELARQDAKQAFLAQMTSFLVASLAWGLGGGMVVGAVAMRLLRTKTIASMMGFDLTSPPTNPVEAIFGGALIGVLVGFAVACCLTLVLAIAKGLGWEKHASRLQRQIGPLPWTNVHVLKVTKGQPERGGEYYTPSSAAEYATETAVRDSVPKPPTEYLGRRVLVEPWFLVAIAAWILFLVAEVVMRLTDPRRATPNNKLVGAGVLWVFFMLSEAFFFPMNRAQHKKALSWLLLAGLPIALLSQHVVPLEARLAMSRAVERVMRLLIGE